MVRAQAAPRPWVVKIGGSLAAGPHTLRDWLRAVEAGRRRAVVVPGGGPFADAVRAAQAALGFDDSTAHRMALLAMEQYGAALCALAPGFVPAATPDDMVRARRDGLVPVWAPSALALAAAEIPHRWEVTSDSLAAWLAGRLDAEALVLVKSAPRPADGTPLETVMEQGLVDPAFSRFAPPGCAVACLGPGDPRVLAAALAGQGGLPGQLATASAGVWEVAC
ncbi:amino acid kinase family protein [Azospirillum sp. ST 5-10]|uniref:amino acid kinase family protein n=1 Tax=unclassified Azospirillum TaxID=2630922 RepID=UPI003F4A6167